MTYEYQCEKCGKRFDVIKSVKDMDVNEYCPACGEPAIRQFVPSKVHISGAKVTHPEYNPGLGCVVKNKRHKEDLCKRMDVVEIGNDYKSPDTIHKEYDQKREERKEQRYDQAMKEI